MYDLTEAEIDELVDEIEGPVYDPRLDGVIEYFAAEEEADVEEAWAERMQEVRQLAEQHPELRDPEVLEAVIGQADALAEQAGLDDVDRAFFVTDPGTIRSTLAAVSTGTDPAEAYERAAWDEIRAAGAGAIDPEEHRRHEVKTLQREARALRDDAVKERRNPSRVEVAKSLEARAERLEAQARERATNRSSGPFEDEAPAEVLSGTERIYLDEWEPSREERLTAGIEADGGDPDDYGDRAFAEIAESGGGDPFR